MGVGLSRGFVTAAVAALVVLIPRGLQAAEPYDPLRTEAGAAEPIDLVVRDETRQRDIPVRVHRPAGQAAAPVVLFSHGLGGSREGSAFLGRHWAARGYVAVFLQHPGSDEAVWQETAPARRRAAMQEAASARNFLLRVRDVPAVLDALERWNVQAGHALQGRLRSGGVGMSGHSFGAVTTQAVSGQSFAARRVRADPRIRAAIVMSPSVPARGSAEAAFGSVRLPWLLMTGTRDDSPIGGATAASRLRVFAALPAGDKYQLVLHGAEHSVFTDRRLRADAPPRDPRHHEAILAISTAFWDAFLRGDAQARRWLDGEGPRTVLAADDLWQRK